MPKKPNTDQPVVAERKRVGIGFCCMRTAEKYHDNQRGNIPVGTVIRCEKCSTEIIYKWGWSAKADVETN